MQHEHDPLANDLRRARRSRKLGSDAACALCGITEPAVLDRTRRLLEQHHALGQDIDPDLTVVLCRNCHALATARQHDTGVANSNTEPATTVLHRLDQALRSLASLLQLLADAFFRWASMLRALIVALDQHAPTWRTLDAATVAP
jgi:hypothetical protein